jgi:hypothetical protein
MGHSNIIQGALQRALLFVKLMAWLVFDTGYGGS